MSKKTEEAVPESFRVAVLEVAIGEPLLIRSNPSQEEVLEFVKEHNRRYLAGEPGGTNLATGQVEQAYLIKSARYVDHEFDLEAEGTPIDLSSVL